jgi:glycosyltransferase involved in cell wall biosynthesis
MSLKLSIIIPCFNCQETLHEAVDSCYTQGFVPEEFEVVMVNDGSTDQTAVVMAEIAAKYSNVKLVSHNKNQGGGAARNTAVANSMSEVIFCLDSDDLLPPNTLNKMLAYLEEKKCDAVVFNTSINFIGSDLNNISHTVTMAKPGEKIIFTDLFQTPKAMCGLYQVFMFTKKAFYQTSGYPTEHSFDTQGFAWRFLAAGLVVYTCPGATYLLRVQFKESYYLREYNNGKNNFNWQLIFLEHNHLFSDQTQHFIKDFNCQDFTRDIFSELIAQPNILRDNYQDLIGQPQTRDTVFVQTKKPVARNSLFGFYLRSKKRVFNFFTHLS